jgi:hypothetical protein
MTKDDVICVAFKAGLTIGTNMSGIGLVGSPADIGIAHITLDQMHHFADIVAAAEREACANVCESVSPFGSHLALQKATIEDCAEAIRARGNNGL